MPLMIPGIFLGTPFFYIYSLTHYISTVPRTIKIAKIPTTALATTHKTTVNNEIRHPSNALYVSSELMHSFILNCHKLQHSNIQVVLVEHLPEILPKNANL